MRFKHMTWAVSAVVLAGAVPAAVASPTTVYDSRGFESPAFAAGPLDGQGNGLWIESGGGAAAGTATVGPAAFTGTQGVTVVRTDSTADGGDKRYWPSLPAVTPTAAQNVVSVSWDPAVAANATPGVGTGPFFGVEAYDSNANLIAAAGVDATTGEVLFADPAFGGGFNNTTADDTVRLGAWDHFTLSMDFTADTAAVYVNGVLCGRSCRRSIRPA